MPTVIARNDAVAVPQISTLTPTAVNGASYRISVNTKSPPAVVADASATVEEIVDLLQPELSASTIQEVAEITYSDSETFVTATGPADGKPFTIVDATGGKITVATPTTAESRNHWIAKNFSGAALPVNGDDVVLTGLSSDQSFYYNLNQNTVSLASLDLKADSEAKIGLPEFTGSPQYYQGGYRDTHLRISAAILKIGEGIGNGSPQIKINLGTTVPCAATILRTSANKADQDEAPVHLVGGTTTNSLHMFGGEVDLAMLPGTLGEWPTIVCSGGVLRCGAGVVLTTIEAAGNSTVETRSAVTTLRTRDSGSVTHFGNGNIATLDVAGGKATIEATGNLTIGQLNGYGGKELDLSRCDGLVTITAATIYATPGSTFTIRDPNNKLVMTAAASTPNGAQSLVVITGSGKNVRIT